MNRHPLLQTREELLEWAEAGFQDRSTGSLQRTAKTILLTGATGFIGAHVLEMLLRRTEATIYCLVRSADRENARQRLDERLATLKITLSEDEAERIVCLSGDVTEVRFGLTGEIYRFLLDSIDSIFHFAASTNWVAPFGSEAVGNINALKEVLQLMSCGKKKILNYASSMGVHATLADPLDREIREGYRLPLPQTLYGAYCQTKWINEEICEQARSSGAAINVFRIGDVKGRARDGVWDPTNFGNQFMLACAGLGIFPRVSTRFNFLPVDFVAESVVALSQRAVNRTFQFNSSHHIEAPELQALLSRRRRLDLVDETTWLNKLGEAKEYAPAKAIRPIFKKLRFDAGTRQKSFFDIGTHLYLRRHDDTNTRELIGEKYNRGFDIHDVVNAIVA